MSGDKFYLKAGDRFGSYQFKGREKIFSGEKLDFFTYVNGHGDKDFRVLDLGCGSGELTKRLGPYFGKIIGVDPSDAYIKTGTRSKGDVQNVVFQVGNGTSLRFPAEHFDLIYSSRGPLSENMKFMKESYRVLKPGGIMLEETIGDNDKIEIKEIFGRGQNYDPKNGVQENRADAIKGMLEAVEMELVEIKPFVYYESYPTFEDVIMLLERAPIIEDFDLDRDALRLMKLEEALGSKGVVLSSSRIHWKAIKTGYARLQKPIDLPVAALHSCGTWF